jgi:hypothetical protein
MLDGASALRWQMNVSCANCTSPCIVAPDVSTAHVLTHASIYPCLCAPACSWMDTALNCDWLDTYTNAKPHVQRQAATLSSRTFEDWKI